MLNLPPLKINSLAAGVRAKGLHDLLSGAEDLMRQGKFQSAVDRYKMAQDVAPNNPLVPLGRATAELGGGAYRQASTDLHVVFMNDPATLMAQYGIDQWFPAGRLDQVRQELTQLSSQDAKDEMPEFLLTFLAYNAGNMNEARQHLAEAQKRSGGKDPSLKLMETDWKLGSSEQPPAPSDLNK
jgi:Tfp pilus assembly protein PilF